MMLINDVGHSDDLGYTLCTGPSNQLWTSPLCECNMCLNCMGKAKKLPVTKTHKREVASPPSKVGLGCQGVCPLCGVDACTSSGFSSQTE